MILLLSSTRQSSTAGVWATGSKKTPWSKSIATSRNPMQPPLRQLPSLCPQLIWWLTTPPTLAAVTKLIQPLLVFHTPATSCSTKPAWVTHRSESSSWLCPSPCFALPSSSLWSSWTLCWREVSLWLSRRHWMLTCPTSLGSLATSLSSLVLSWPSSCNRLRFSHLLSHLSLVRNSLPHRCWHRIRSYTIIHDYTLQILIVTVNKFM